MFSLRTSVLPHRGAIAVALMALAAGCASTAPGSGASEVASMQRGDRYLITADEIANAGANNLYDAVAKLRPDFFKPRGNTMSAVASPGSSSRGNGPPAESTSSTGVATAGAPVPVRVYHGDQMLMGPDDLRQIPMSSVVEVRFIPGPQAGVRYGTNHAGGVIMVKTR